MKNIFLSILFIVVFQHTTYGQIWKDAQKLLNSATSELTEEDAVAGIKEALVQGTSNSVELVSVLDGYFGNPEIKIPLPDDALIIEEKLRSIGLGSHVDDAILSINRAAEDAAVKAKPIFVAAVKEMTVNDAIDIVKGDEHAATQYLEKTTSDELTESFQPDIEESLEKVDATKYWEDMISTYNKIPFVQKVNPNLEEYVTQKAIEGLFTMIAKEEEKIRKDPAARTTEILEKVFGN